MIKICTFKDFLSNSREKLTVASKISKLNRHLTGERLTYNDHCMSDPHVSNSAVQSPKSTCMSFAVLFETQIHFKFVLVRYFHLPITAVCIDGLIFFWILQGVFAIDYYVNAVEVGVCFWVAFPIINMEPYKFVLSVLTTIGSV